MFFLGADLHPGNILVQLEPPPGPVLSTAAYLLERLRPFGFSVPSSWREPAIVLLDVGAPRINLSLTQSRQGSISFLPPCYNVAANSQGTSCHPCTGRCRYSLSFEHCLSQAEASK